MGTTTEAPATCSASSWNDLADVQLEANAEYDSRHKVDNIKIAGSERPWHNQGWTTSWTTGADPTGWITFTFPQPVALKGLRTKQHQRTSWYGSAFKDFHFDFSTDEGETWTSFYQGQGSNLHCCEWQEIDFGSSTPPSQMFRLVMDSDWGYGALMIEQLQLETCSGV